MTPPRPVRRFPPPWSVEETDACFIVRDANRQALTSVCRQEKGAWSAMSGVDHSDEVLE